MDLPRFSRKEVRQFADEMVTHGFVFDGFDTKGHSIFVWPASGESFTLPETPKAHGWKSRTRRQAYKIMGKVEKGKAKKASHAPTPQGRLIQERIDGANQRRQIAGMVGQLADLKEFAFNLGTTVNRLERDARPSTTMRRRLLEVQAEMRDIAAEIRRLDPEALPRLRTPTRSDYGVRGSTSIVHARRY